MNAKLESKLELELGTKLELESGVVDFSAEEVEHLQKFIAKLLEENKNMKLMLQKYEEIIRLLREKLLP